MAPVRATRRRRRASSSARPVSAAVACALSLLLLSSSSPPAAAGDDGRTPTPADGGPGDAGDAPAAAAVDAPPTALPPAAAAAHAAAIAAAAAAVTATTTADTAGNTNTSATGCTFAAGVDYEGTTAHVVGSSTRAACCAACRKTPSCAVAVLSSPTDDPPSECWLKTGPLFKTHKAGVSACQPAGRTPELIETRREARFYRRHGRRYRVLTPSQRAMQKKASGTLMLLIICMVVGQTGIFYWKKAHFRSYQNVTLACLWAFPLLGCIRMGWWRFVFISSVFSVVTGYYVRLATKVPLDVQAPRMVYWWFNRVYAGCLCLGFVGYVLLMLEMTGFARAALSLRRFLAELATLSLFYGLYFGVLGRDLAELCSHRMNSAMGYTKKDDDEPQRMLPANTCALCGLDLNPDLEHLIEGQDYAQVERYRMAGAYGAYALTGAGQTGGLGRGGRRGGRRGRGRAGVYPEDEDGMGPERGGGLDEALRPERVVKLKCGHEFHEFCIRGWTIVGKQTVCPNCGEQVDVRSVLGSSPWEKNPNLIWGQLLDAVRYLVVWNPIIMLFVRFSVYEVETHGGF